MVVQVHIVSINLTHPLTLEQIQIKHITQMSLRSCLYDLIPKEVCFGAPENVKHFPENQEFG